MSWPSTFTRLLAGLCLAIAVVAATAPAARAQTPLEKLVSPGSLSEAHAKLESNCGSCHASFNKKAQATLCLDCHKDIAADFDHRSGFHGRSPQTRSVDCKACHTEHKGRKADIVGLKRASFDHQFTDFPLLGGHAKLACAQCHAEGTSFSKAATSCFSCHLKDDPHFGRLGQDCASCHVVDAWKVVRFDHARTGFSLTGAHTKVECLGCHENQVWKGVANTCATCHAKDDAHQGRFGRDCAACHSTEAWKVQTFDHSKTRFPLVGAHARAGCADCHRGSINTLVSIECSACHAKDDVHKGDNGKTCADCHTVSTWKAIRFDHNRTAFPLLGEHAKATCQSCHIRPITSWKPPKDCQSCHQKDDKHEGVLGPDCQTCHEAVSWARVHFEHARDANFALRGAHAPLSCPACHTRSIVAAKTPASCVGCHQKDDPHKGQLGGGCASCHNETNWTRTAKFDHDLTRFPLLGKHASVDCKDCHKSSAFLDAASDCTSCHASEDKHKGRFGSDCAQCHNPVSWSRWTFNHDAATAYPLTGKHRTATCESCHMQSAKKASQQSSRCVSCHSADDKHRGGFGSSCERCHTTEAFWAVELKR